METEVSDKHKVYITNLDGTVSIFAKQANEKDLEDELRTLFEKYGTIETLTVKRSRNADYHFAFMEYKQGEDAAEAIKK